MVWGKLITTTISIFTRYSGSRTIFGGTFMKNHDVLFDKENTRIGFIRSDCSAGYNPASYPKSRIPCKHRYTILYLDGLDANYETEENYIPRILAYGALAILVMLLFSIFLARCRNTAVDHK